MSENSNKSVIDNRRVMKNTVFLYLRMLFVMIISLYTVRIVLRELGVVDYGINNVVGSVVALCSFLTSSLTAVCNRYFSKEIVKGDKVSFNNCFCLNVTSFSVLALLAVVLLETFGIWYLNNKMIIPEDRMFAAHIVYQFSIINLCLSFISIPYNSLIISHERMSFFAYVGIFESVAKLLVAYLIVISVGDKLIYYNFLSLIVTVAVTLAYIIYCFKYFSESRYRFYWNKKEFEEIFTFVSWYFFGSISAVIKSSGLNLLINALFSPSVNAARAIAFQVEGALRKFTDGFFTASKPQIYKAYSNNEHEGLNRMLIRTSLICTFLMAFLSLPIFFNAESILSLWLGNVPQKSVIFLQLIIIDSILNVITEPIILTILATGQQKIYQIVEFILRVSILPISYMFLSFGYEAEITMVVSILMSIISVYVRILMLAGKYSKFELKRFMKYVTKLILGYTFIIILVKQIEKDSMNEFLYIIFSSVIVSLLGLFLLFYMLEQKERYIIMSKSVHLIAKKKYDE